MRWSILSCAFVAILSFAGPARGQTPAVGSAEPPPEATEASEASAPTLVAVARGLYVETLVGGGYAVLGSTVPSDPTYPTLAGEDEGLGGGSLVRLALGFDITEGFALEAVGGMALVASRRQDWVRDLGIAYGGLGGRLTLALGERLMLHVGAGGGYAQASNGVEAAASGPAVFGGLGLEYYVHVRHFSLGVDIATLVPLSPTRVFIALAPQLKYTF